MLFCNNILFNTCSETSNPERLTNFYILNLKESWEEHLPLAEFIYNKSYQASINKAQYEALYCRKCRSPTRWDKVGTRRFLGPELVLQALNKIHLIRDRLRVQHSRQKSYADQRRRGLEFQEGNYVFLSLIYDERRFLELKGS